MKNSYNISEARIRKARTLAAYKDPFDAYVDLFESQWRNLWAEDCSRTGKTVPFKEWFFATDDNGECPFEAAGGWYVDTERLGA